MKLRTTEWLAILALTASTASCTQTPGTLGPNTSLNQQTAASSLTPLNNRALVSISVRWPQRRQTQAIPDATTKIVVSVCKDGTELKSKELVRGANALDTATFDLDPALKTITIKANALDANNGILSTGENTVTLRNNTISQVSLLLSARGLSISDSAAYALLNDPISLVNRYSNLKDSGSDLSELVHSIQNLGSSMQGLDGSNLQATGSVLDKIFYKGYLGDVTFDATTSTHKASVYIVPDETKASPPDNTTATASLEVNAAQWATYSYPIVSLIGGQLPATGSVESLKASVNVFANGLSTNAANASLTIDNFRQPNLDHFYQFLKSIPNNDGPFLGLKQAFTEQHYVPPIFTPFLAKTPTHCAFNLSSTPLDAALDLNIMPETLTGTLQGTIAAVDNNGAKLPIEVYAALGSDGILSIKLTDTTSHLQAIGTLTITQYQVPEIHVKFYDKTTGNYLAKLDYKPCLTEDGFDMSRLANWPTLVLNDGNNTEVPMTPGYFLGERDASGSLNIGVR